MIDRLEVVTVGRISVDLYAEQVGVAWNDVRSFAKSVGGSATNVAVAAARLGRRAAVLTRVGDDPPGRYLVAALADFGVDTGLVSVDAELPTPLALAVPEQPDAPTLLFYRQPSAPDLQLTGDELDATTLERVPVVWLTGTGFSAEPSRSAHHRWLRTRARRDHTVLDLDYRPQMWGPEEAGEQMRTALPLVTVAIGNMTECHVATGADSPDAAADRLLEHGVQLAIVKLGAEGVLVATGDERAMLPPVAVDVVCGLGAGDAFGGAVVHGLLEGWDPAQIVRFANAAGAHVSARLLCSDAMPSQAEVYALLESKEGPA